MNSDTIMMRNEAKNEDILRYIQRAESKERLDLQRKKIKYIDDYIRYMTNIKSLYLCENELTHLPDSMGDLINLKYLDLSRNELKELPDNFGNGAKELNLSSEQRENIQEIRDNILTILYD